MRIIEQGKPEGFTNIWVHDSVCEHVEKELREMEDKVASVTRCFPFSGELFHFIEMELKELNSSVLLETNPRVLHDSKFCREVSTSQPSRVPCAAQTKSRRRAVSTGAMDNRQRRVINRHQDPACSRESSVGVRSSLMPPTLMHNYSRLEAINRRKVKRAVESLLCLKDLDECPLPRSMNFRSTYKSRVPSGPSGGVLGGMMSGVSSLEGKRSCDECQDKDSYKKRKIYSVSEAKTGESEKQYQMTQLYKMESNVVNVSSAASGICKNLIPYLSDLSVKDSCTSQYAAHQLHPCSQPEEFINPNKMHSIQHHSAVPSNFKNISQVTNYRQSSNSVKANQCLKHEMNDQSVGAMRTKDDNARISMSGLGLPLHSAAITNSGLPMHSEFSSGSCNRDTLNALKEPSRPSLVTKPCVATTPAHHLPITTVSSNSPFFPYLSQTFLCICSDPHMSVSNPLAHTGIQGTNATLQQLPPDTELSPPDSVHETTAMVDDNASLIGGINNNVLSDDIADGEPSRTGMKSQVEKSQHEDGENIKSPKLELLLSLASNTKYGGGLLGYERNKSIKDYSTCPDSKAPSIIQHQHGDIVHKKELHQPGNALIKLSRGSKPEMNSNALEPTRLYDFPNKQPKGLEDSTDLSRSSGMVVDGCRETSCRVMNKVITNTQNNTKCVPDTKISNDKNRVVPYSKFSSCLQLTDHKTSDTSYRNTDHGREKSYLPPISNCTAPGISASGDNSTSISPSFNSPIECVTDKKLVYKTEAQNASKIIIQTNKNSKPVKSVEPFSTQSQHFSKVRVDKNKNVLFYPRNTEANKCLPLAGMSFASKLDHGINTGAEERILNKVDFGKKLQVYPEERREQSANKVLLSGSLCKNNSEFNKTQASRIPQSWDFCEGTETSKQNFEPVQKLHSSVPSIQEVYQADVLLEEKKDKNLSIYTINYQLVPPFKADTSSDSAILLRRNLEGTPSTHSRPKKPMGNVMSSIQYREKEVRTCPSKTPKIKVKTLFPIKMQVMNVAGTDSIISTLIDVAQVAASSWPLAKGSTESDSVVRSCREGQISEGKVLNGSNPVTSRSKGPQLNDLATDQTNNKDPSPVQTKSSCNSSCTIPHLGSTPCGSQRQQWRKEYCSVKHSERSTFCSPQNTLLNKSSFLSSAENVVDDSQHRKSEKRKRFDGSPRMSEKRVKPSSQEFTQQERNKSLDSSFYHLKECSPSGPPQTSQNNEGTGDILHQAIQENLFDILASEDGIGCPLPVEDKGAQEYSGCKGRVMQKNTLVASPPRPCPKVDYGWNSPADGSQSHPLEASSGTTVTTSTPLPIPEISPDGKDITPGDRVGALTPPQSSPGDEHVPGVKVMPIPGPENKSDLDGTKASDKAMSDEDSGEYSSDGISEGETHADQLPFRCEFCGRLFKHKRSRDRHVKLHTGDKKYKCCHCEAAFSRSDHLKIHKKTHDTQKPYQCSVCNRGYNTAAALTAHMQNHKAKLTAHALNQLLKDAQAPVETHGLTQLFRDSAAAEAHTQSLNNFVKEGQKEMLLSPKRVEIAAGSSPGELTTSLAGEQSPSLSPLTAVRCPVCHAHCRSQSHLQRHVSRYHGEDPHLVPLERPASRGGGSGTSSVGGASSAASTPSPRPPSSLPSPRPLSNPLLSLVSGKLACLYCSRDGFPSLEALQLHLQSSHGSVMNGEMRDMTTMLSLHPSLGASLSASGMATSLTSPLGPGSSRGVSCELCGARLSSVTALQRHVVTAHTFTDLLARAAEGVFCAQCLLPFSNPGALAEHIKLVHTSPVLSAVLNKRPPSPQTDTPTDLSKKSRHDGLTADLPASTLLCSQCNAPFTNFEAFRRHLRSHLDGGEQMGTTGGGGQLACPECRLPLASEAALEGHLATHLGVTTTEYGCQACMKLFSKPDELQKHLMDIHAHHLYRCALCKEMFDSKVSIQVHFAVKHSNECKVHKCTRCSLIFRSQSEFEGHIRVSHIRRSQLGSDLLGGVGVVGGGGSYRCLLCTLSLSSEAELAAHVSTHQRQFQCSLCDDAFHVEFLLDKHMQTQHNSELNGNVPQPENLAKPRRSPQKKDLRCDICDADFSTESALITHRKQAHNIKSGSVGVTAKVAAASLSLFCAYCSEACKSRADLEAHMKSHQGNGGRHKCNICDELCPSATALAQHKLTHVKVVSGSACAVCREPLSSEQQFTQHQNEHHPSPLPQPCVVCRQTLVTDMEVSVHARFHATKAAQAAAAAASAASHHPHTSNSLVMTTTSSTFTTTTNSTNSTSSSNSGSHGSTSPHLSPSLRCLECHLKFETGEEAETHASVHHQQQQQQQRQQEQQQQSQPLSYAKSIASSSRTYQCIKCQESFASEAEIESHVASHLLHEGSVHECHLCRATFDTPLRLQCHLIEHTFEGCGSFTCYMCSSVFTTASRLQQHMVEHGLSARPYDCHHCHQRFFFRAELENHVLSHPEAAEGECRECVTNFPELSRHTVRHPSLPCVTPKPSAAPNIPQNEGKLESRQAHSPSSPHEEVDIGPTNGHLSSAADSVED